eukprot:3601304-Pleurochrysis_carterae.AAC.3
MVQLKGLSQKHALYMALHFHGMLASDSNPHKAAYLEGRDPLAGERELADTQPKAAKAARRSVGGGKVSSSCSKRRAREEEEEESLSEEDSEKESDGGSVGAWDSESSWKT